MNRRKFFGLLGATAVVAPLVKAGPQFTHQEYSQTVSVPKRDDTEYLQRLVDRSEIIPAGSYRIYSPINCRGKYVYAHNSVFVHPKNVPVFDGDEKSEGVVIANIFLEAE